MDAFTSPIFWAIFLLAALIAAVVRRGMKVNAEVRRKRDEIRRSRDPAQRSAVPGPDISASGPRRSGFVERGSCPILRIGTDLWQPVGELNPSFQVENLAS